MARPNLVRRLPVALAVGFVLLSSCREFSMLRKTVGGGGGGAVGGDEDLIPIDEPQANEGPGHEGDGSGVRDEKVVDEGGEGDSDNGGESPDDGSRKVDVPREDDAVEPPRTKKGGTPNPSPAPKGTDPVPSPTMIPNPTPAPSPAPTSMPSPTPRPSATPSPTVTPGPCPPGPQAAELQWARAGVRLNGICWYLGTVDKSCDDVCTQYGGYHELTATLAGSQAPDEGACASLIASFDGILRAELPPPSFYRVLPPRDDANFGPLGCYINHVPLASGYISRRGVGQATTSDSLHPGMSRVCGCQATR